MSGFVGYTSKNIDKNIIEKMSERIKHRGPDGEGYHIDKFVALSHRNLIVNKNDKISQPIYNDNKTKLIVMDATIYNLDELREELKELKYKFKTKTTGEVLLAGYEEWQEKLPEKLRGMFAFAIWDSKKKELFIARDKWGIKPIYYAKINDTFMFASELKALLEHPDFKKELNEEILAAYLCFNSTPTEETFFKGVYRLSPGHTLKYKDGKINLNQYFKLEFDENDISMEDAIKKIRSSMEDSVKRHFECDVPMGSFLSSGIDSSYIASLAKPEKTFTVGYENPRYDEIKYAKELAKKLGIENINKKITKEEYISELPNIIYYMDEPIADPAGIALYFGAGAASEHVKIVTSGEGADELFAGYNNYKTAVDTEWYLRIPYFIRHPLYWAASLFADMRGFNFVYRNGQKLEDEYIGLGRVFRDKEAMKLLINKNQSHTRDIVKPIYNNYKNNSDTIKRQAIDFYFWLVQDFLHVVDRTTMMFSVEARTPFLDDAVYEAAKVLPVSVKINKETTKVALRKASETVIPNEAHKKKKLGFPVPLREWVKEDDLYSDIKEKFASDTAKKFFKVDKINKLLEDHKSGKKDCYKKVWNIYTFIIWYDIYFKD